MTATTDAIAWLKKVFGTKIDAAVAGTPFTRNLIVAIAMQETSYIWRPQYKNKSVDEVLTLCVGDTIDAPGRKAFLEIALPLRLSTKAKRCSELGERRSKA